VRCPPGLTGPQVAAAIRKHGFQIATGYGRMKDESFRIGHMGDHTVDRLEALLDALAKVLKR
jgi:aspartate aminotransferase-like enzyme